MSSVDPISLPPLTHAEAMDLQAQELDRTIALLSSLTDSEWAAQTECPDWDVRRMYLHVLGACEAGARIRENVRQLTAAWLRRRREGGPLEAALSATQVQHREDLSPAEIVAQLSRTAPNTVRGRRRTPSLMRDHVKIAVDGPVIEKWALGYLLDTIYLRDLWMHRVDATRATGRTMELTADHDGRIVADVVAEWARRHRWPFVLKLHGPAGGSFAHDPDATGAEHHSLDAVDFCRTLAGRQLGTGLLSTVVPF